MRMVIAGLVLCALGACVADDPAHTHVGGLDRFERAGIVAADSCCDSASARDTSDPASHCFVSRGKKN